MPAWYTTYYGKQYADSVRNLLIPQRTAAEVAFIRQITRLQPPAAIADVACGEGRHTRLLAGQGFDVTGVDQNPDFIASARSQAPAGAHFLVGDMREAVGGPYQLVMLLYHSFGFFADEENRCLLQSWSERLAHGGWCVVDVWNRDAIIRHLQPTRVWQASPDLEVRENYAFDPLTGRSEVHYTYVYGDGSRYEYDANFRLYTYTELRDLLASVGMTPHSVYGSLTGDPYSLDARRLVLFARRITRLDPSA